MVLTAQFFPVGWIGACLLPPKTARTELPSTTAVTIVGVTRYFKRKPILEFLSKQMVASQALQNEVPPGGTQDNSFTTWPQAVEAWMVETHNFLKAHSETAASGFLHNRGGDAGLRYGGVAVAVHDWYATLISLS